MVQGCGAGSEVSSDLDWTARLVGIRPPSVRAGVLPNSLSPKTAEGRAVICHHVTKPSFDKVSNIDHFYAGVALHRHKRGRLLPRARSGPKHTGSFDKPDFGVLRRKIAIWSRREDAVVRGTRSVA